jgi:hypothetical protein
MLSDERASKMLLSVMGRRIPRFYFPLISAEVQNMHVLLSMDVVVHGD